MTGTVAVGFLGVFHTEKSGECAGAQHLLSSVELDSGTELTSSVTADCTRCFFFFFSLPEKYVFISSGDFFFS